MLYSMSIRNKKKVQRIQSNALAGRKAKAHLYGHACRLYSWSLAYVGDDCNRIQHSKCICRRISFPLLLKFDMFYFTSSPSHIHFLGKPFIKYTFLSRTVSSITPFKSDRNNLEDNERLRAFWLFPQQRKLLPPPWVPHSRQIRVSNRCRWHHQHGHDN